jgi:hypothetical protein
MMISRSMIDTNYIDSGTCVHVSENEIICIEDINYMSAFRMFCGELGKNTEGLFWVVSCLLAAGNIRER